MEFFTILISAIKESLASNLNLETLGAITLVSSVLYALYFFGLKLKTKLLAKKQNSYEHQTGLSISSEQHLRELEELKKKMASGSHEPIRIDAVKALYIAQNWDEYNLVASEDSKILFEKMRTQADVVDAKEIPSTTLAASPFSAQPTMRTEYLGDNEFRIYTELGYMHYKDGVLIGAKVFEDADKNQKTKNKKSTIVEKKEAEMVKSLSVTEATPAPTQKSLDEFLASLNKNRQEKTGATPPLPSTSQGSVDKSDVFEEDIFVDDTPKLDPKAMANLVAGKKPSAPKTPKPKLEYHMLYSFENVKSFFGSSFLSEPDNFYKEKLISFLSFLSQHPFVFFANGHQTMLVHVDSFVMALTRSIMEDNREPFLNMFYPDGSLSNDALCKALEQFQNRLMSLYDNHFMFSSNLQSGKKAYMFTRGLKTSGKIVKGEFVIFQFKDATRVLIQEVVNSGFENSEVIATKASEFDSIGGKRLKLKSKEEILKVL